MLLRTVHYRVLKSSWGIWIDLTARASFTVGAEHLRVAPAWPLWLDFEGPAAQLTQPFREELRTGLAAVAPELCAKVGDQPVTVIVTEVTSPETDFQAEGLAVAMCRWTEEEFGLPHRQIDESYDRATNRYIFTWR